MFPTLGTGSQSLMQAQPQSQGLGALPLGGMPNQQQPTQSALMQSMQGMHPQAGGFGQSAAPPNLNMPQSVPPQVPGYMHNPQDDAMAAALGVPEYMRGTPNPQAVTHLGGMPNQQQPTQSALMQSMQPTQQPNQFAQQLNPQFFQQANPQFAQQMQQMQGMHPPQVPGYMQYMPQIPPHMPQAPMVQQVMPESPRMQVMRNIQRGGGGPEFMHGQYSNFR